MKEENSMMPANPSMISGLEWKHQGKSCITQSSKLCPLAGKGGDEHIAFGVNPLGVSIKVAKLYALYF